MIRKALKDGYAVPCFVYWNLPSLEAIINAAEKENSPVMICIPDKERWKHVSYDPFVSAGRTAAEKAKVPVVLNLDHGISVGSVVYAIRSGMTSVMIDGSSLSLKENINLTKKIVEIAHPVGVPVEGELGRTSRDAPVETKPEEASIFVEETNVDSLSISIGNVSGTPTGEAKINLDLLQQIKDSTDIPLVLHGGTGVSNESARKAIKMGVYKINVGTELVTNFVNEAVNNISQPKTAMEAWKIWFEASKSAMTRIEKVARSRIRAFGSAEHGTFQ